MDARRISRFSAAVDIFPTATPPLANTEVGSERAVLTLLQGYLAQAELPRDGRLPPERELADTLGVSRAALRKALAVLEADGHLWRHVGRGTFLGPRPLDAIGDVAAVAGETGPAEVMQARLSLEPECAALAASHASARQIARLRALLDRPRPATWRQFEGMDAEFHRAIAEAAGNRVLLHLFDTLSAIRRAVTWGRTRSGEGPPPAHHSFAEHDALLVAIAGRDPARARAAMAAHIATVRDRLLDR